MNPVAPLLLLFLAATASPHAAPLTGEAVVRSIGEDRVAVLLDSNHDDKIDHGFLLSSDLPVSRLSVYFKSAAVEFNDSYVRLIGDEELYEFHVAGHPDPPAAPKELHAVRYIGYALQHSTGDGHCTFEQARDGDVGACYSFGEQ